MAPTFLLLSLLAVCFYAVYVATLFFFRPLCGPDEWPARIPMPQSPSSKSVPLILSATNFYVDNALTLSFLNSSQKPCAVKCEYTDDISRYEEADIALFHQRNLNENQLRTLSRIRNPKRLNVLYSAEAPPNEHFDLARVPKGFFNLTMTYSRKSHLPITSFYDSLEAIRPGESRNAALVWQGEEVQRRVAQKTQLASQIVSNCETHSRREVLTKSFSSDVVVFGRCNSQSCDEECYVQQLEKSFFYLAFENSVCDDYVTEKFWNFKKHLVVPVVLKRSVVSKLAPDEYFLALDDFSDVDALIAEMKYYAGNLTAYSNFLSWTKKFRKAPADKNIFCTTCEAAHKQTRHSIPDLAAWWRKYASSCQRDFSLFWSPQSNSLPSRTLAIPITLTLTFPIHRFIFAFP